ncbi:hypothetical protein NHQ30_005939 [Ciborinia camelliae]|nr:hypothetical protein NHQ30_005939 [Ciborinia camelliae]
MQGLDNVPQDSSISIQDLGVKIEKELAVRDVIRLRKKTRAVRVPARYPLRSLDITVREASDTLKGGNDKGAIEQAPINLLDLRSNLQTPWPLFSQCDLLAEAIRNIEYRPSSCSPGLSKLKGLIGCLNFALYAQAGAISGPHIDHHGALTWVTLEEDRGDGP